MNQQETKVYRKYRHYLTNESRFGTHAAARRQNARAKVVAEFAIPFAEVKRIVAVGDELSGVTHVKPAEVDRSGELMLERKPVSEMRVGDRVKYFDTDARIIAIEGHRVTMRGLSSQSGSVKVKKTFTYDLSPENWNGRQMTLPVVTNRAPRILTGAEA